MDVFLARQPILDANEKVCAYEILYRSGMINKFMDTPGDEASAKVMLNTFQTFGIESLTNNKPAFINFTAKLIIDEVATLFSKRDLVVEILENIKIDKEILEKCMALKKKGYKLALDDFVYKEEFKPLVKIADVIKLDFLRTKRPEIEAMINELKGYDVTFLAEKVETREEFEYAKSLGCSLFQGYFFQKPQIMTSKVLSPLKFSYLEIMSKVNEDELDFDELAELITRDLSLTYNLLRLVNAASLALESVNSVKHALIILGENEVRKWINLIALKGLGEGRPNELVRNSLIRAKFCELVAEKVKGKDKSADCFLVGLFSLIDTILQKPLEEILTEIKTPQKVKDALLDKSGEYADIFKQILSYERAEPEKMMLELEKNEVDDKGLMDLYLDSLLWCKDLEDSI